MSIVADQRDEVYLQRDLVMLDRIEVSYSKILVLNVHRGSIPEKALKCNLYQNIVLGYVILWEQQLWEETNFNYFQNCSDERNIKLPNNQY